MPRSCSTELATHLRGSATTICFLLKIMPKQASTFGITTLDADVEYDDGSGSLTYRAKRGYTPLDVDTRSDLSVDNSEASGLLAEYPADGVTADGIARGDYDGARFVQYLVNYEDLTQGHMIIISGQVGQVKNLNDLTMAMEMRSLTDILKQNSLIEVTSITCRARFGDERCKMPLRWYSGAVDTVGAEADRTFTSTVAPGTDSPPGGSTGTVTNVPFFQGDGTTTTAQLLDTSGEPVKTGFTVTGIKVNGSSLSGSDYSVDGAGLVTFTTAPASGAQVTWSGTVTLQPDGFFVPGVVQWLTGNNAGQECEVESYDASTGTITLAIPARNDIVSGDTFKIRRDCDYSKAMCRDVYNNLLNMRAEPELPRANGTDLQAPTPSAG